jgi:hypothetical protein
VPDYDYGELAERDQQEFLYEQIGFGDDPRDQYAHDLFWDAFYNDNIDIDTRIQIMDELADYLYDEYGVDLEAVWDWDDFRAWYEGG